MYFLMKHDGSNVFLEKHDIIRINKLVRKRIDYEAFLEWYQSLTTYEQAVLIGELCQFAYQAGVDDNIYAVTAEQSKLSQNDDFVIMMKKVKSSGGVNYGGLAKWLGASEPSIRQKAFKWFVYLFGVSEQNLRQNEKPEQCNHWWHRNLEDPKVIRHILLDPEYYKTSPRDDINL